MVSETLSFNYTKNFQSMNNKRLHCTHAKQLLCKTKVHTC